MTTRVLPPENGGSASVPGGAKYVAVAGQTLDIPDADAQALALAGWSLLGTVGSTISSRPTTAPTVTTSLGHIDTSNPIAPVHLVQTGTNPTTWRDAQGNKR
jgi:hypothetical protein